MHHDEPGILDLEVDVLHRIILCLNAQDVLSFTKVCKRFWLATEENDIWQPLCKRFCDNSTYVIDYVNTVSTTVEPVYSPPQEVLASVCEWKRVYMKLIQLKRNFINGVYKSQLFTYYPNDTGHLLAESGLLLLRNEADDGQEVWSVRGKPRRLGMTMYAVTDSPFRVIYNYENYIIVIEVLLFQVFKVNVESGDITRMYIRLVNGSEYSYIPETENIDSWYWSLPAPEEVATSISGKYIFAIVRLHGQNRLHQWNIITGQKISESNVCGHDSTYYDDYTSVNLISPKTYCGVILVALFKTIGNLVEWVILQFNDETFIYEPITLDIDSDVPYIYFENNKIYVISALNNRLALYNLSLVSTTTPDLITIRYTFPIDDFKIRGNIVSYIVGDTLTIKSDSFNDIYDVSLLKNYPQVKIQYFLCDWNILMVSMHDVSQDIGIIELHDIKAKFILMIFECEGLAIGLSFPLTVLVFTESHENYWCTLNALKFW